MRENYSLTELNLLVLMTGCQVRESLPQSLSYLEVASETKTCSSVVLRNRFSVIVLLCPDQTRKTLADLFSFLLLQ